MQQRTWGCLVLAAAWLALAAGQEANREQPCSNRDSRCDTWAGSTQCHENPHFMLDTCPAACKVAMHCALAHSQGVWSGYATDFQTRLFATMYPAAGPAAAAGLFRKIPAMGTFYKPGQKLRGDPWLMLSSLGVGTYLGEPTKADDVAQAAAVVLSVHNGWNVIDTAANYREGHAEEAVGNAFSVLRNIPGLSREMLFVSTKAGFIDKEQGEALLQSRAIDAGDLVQGVHCLHPACLEASLKRSLARMQLSTVDLLYLHNVVEMQLEELGETEVLHRLHEAFVWLEHARQDGSIRAYGMATWDCFRQTPSSAKHLDLHKVVALAEQVGGANHGFRFIQLPVNLGMPEAWQGGGHSWPAAATPDGMPGGNGSVLEAAARLGVGVMGSAPLQEGVLLRDSALMAKVGRDAALSNVPEAAPKLLQLARSTPLLTAAVVGHKGAVHTYQNLKVGTVPALSEDVFQETWRRLAPVQTQ